MDLEPLKQDRRSELPVWSLKRRTVRGETGTMPGESPLSMMRPSRQQLHRPAAAPPVAGKARTCRRCSRAALGRCGRLLVPVAIVVGLSRGWSLGLYYSAAVADRTLAGWVEREAAGGPHLFLWVAGLGGFPFRIQVHCADAEAQVNSYHPPFAVKAKDVTFTARVYRPTLLVGDVTGPLSPVRNERSAAPHRRLVERAGERARAAARSRQRVVHARPAAPRSGRRRRRGRGRRGDCCSWPNTPSFQGRVIAGSPRNHPVIEAVLRLTAATAPTLHPLVAEPIQAEGRGRAARLQRIFAPNPGPRASARCRRQAAASRSSVCGSRAATPLSSARERSTSIRMASSTASSASRSSASNASCRSSASTS